MLLASPRLLRGAPTTSHNKAWNQQHQQHHHHHQQTPSTPLGEANRRKARKDHVKSFVRLEKLDEDTTAAFRENFIDGPCGITDGTAERAEGTCATFSSSNLFLHSSRNNINSNENQKKKKASAMPSEEAEASALNAIHKRQERQQQRKRLEQQRGYQQQQEEEEEEKGEVPKSVPSSSSSFDHHVCDPVMRLGRFGLLPHGSCWYNQQQGTDTASVSILGASTMGKSGICFGDHVMLSPTATTTTTVGPVAAPARTKFAPRAPQQQQHSSSSSACCSLRLPFQCNTVALERRSMANRLLYEEASRDSGLQAWITNSNIKNDKTNNINSTVSSANDHDERSALEKNIVTLPIIPQTARGGTTSTTSATTRRQKRVTNSDKRKSPTKQHKSDSNNTRAKQSNSSSNNNQKQPPVRFVKWFTPVKLEILKVDQIVAHDNVYAGHELLSEHAQRDPLARCHTFDAEVSKLGREMVKHASSIAKDALEIIDISSRRRQTRQETSTQEHQYRLEKAMPLIKRHMIANTEKLVTSLQKQQEGVWNDEFEKGQYLAEAEREHKKSQSIVPDMDEDEVDVSDSDGDEDDF